MTKLITRAAFGFACSAAALCSGSAIAYADTVSDAEQDAAYDAASFYTAPTEFAITKDLVADYGAVPDDANDDSRELQRAINQVSRRGGGKITIPRGRYYLSEIALRSNVTLEIAEGATILPIFDQPRQSQKRARRGNRVKTVLPSAEVFHLGKEDSIENVAIIGLGKGFTLDFTEIPYAKARGFQIHDVDNFYIANVTVRDAQTTFSTLATNAVDREGVMIGPRNGVIENITAFDGHYGYGIIQVKAGVNVLFRNFIGEGGVALRLETGSQGWDDEALIGTMDRVYGENIVCSNGNAAVMVSPHSRDIGSANVRNVYSESCGFAVRIGGGYVPSKYADLEGVTPGKFSSVEISNVHAVYGEQAQVKAKHFGYMPCELRGREEIDPAEYGGAPSYIAPAIAAVVDGATNHKAGPFAPVLTNISAEGFEYQEKVILTDDDKVRNCR